MLGKGVMHFGSSYVSKASKIRKYVNTNGNISSSHHDSKLLGILSSLREAIQCDATNASRYAE
jgi:hypothetical protein